MDEIPWWVTTIIIPFAITYGPRYINKLLRYLFVRYRRWQLRMNYKQARDIIKRVNLLINNKGDILIYKDNAKTHKFLGLGYIAIIYLVQILTLLIYELNYSNVLDYSDFLLSGLGVVYILIGLIMVIGFNHVFNQNTNYTKIIHRYEKKLGLSK